MADQTTPDPKEGYRLAQAEAKAAKARAKALRPWYKKKRFLLGIPLGAMFGLMLIAIATAPSPDEAPLAAASAGGSDRSSATGSSDGTATTPALPSVGDSTALERDGWTITVTAVNRTPSLQSTFLETKNALGVYLVVDMTLQNTSNEQQSLGGDRFKVVDDRDREYEYYLDGTIGNGQQELGARIGPGLTGPATIVFDVPPDATGLILETVGGGRIRLDQ